MTTQSYVTQMTSGEQRVNGMAMIGAAQGLGTAAGPAIGGLLVTFGLLAPLYAAPILIGLVGVAVWAGLPKPDTGREVPAAARVSPRDARMWPFLAVGFGMFLAFGTVMMTVGFLLQDRLGLTSQQTGQMTGMIMLAAAGMMLLVQAGVVPRLNWRPLRLMRAGTVTAAIGLGILTLAPNTPLFAVGMAVLGAGMGVGMPGYMAAPTLLARQDEQGAVAGLVGANNALTFVFGPLIGTALYEVTPSAPYVLSTVLLIAVVGFVFWHPGVRQAPRRHEPPVPAA